MKSIDVSVESFKLKYEEFFIGCDSLEEIGLWDKTAYGEMEVFYMNDLTGVILRLIATDGKITEKEVEYFNKAFGFDYTLEELVAVYENTEGSIEASFDENFENGISLMRKINDKLADAYKELLALCCDIIINSDGVITETEIEEVKRLKALCE